MDTLCIRSYSSLLSSLSDDCRHLANGKHSRKVLIRLRRFEQNKPRRIMVIEIYLCQQRGEHELTQVISGQTFTPESFFPRLVSVM